jgi:hypothetical protein
MTLKLTALFAVLFLVGCQFSGVKYAPGADPLVVQTEALEKRAQNAFDLMLHADNGNRTFFLTNAPGFHGACEWLRTPIDYHGTTMVARAQCIVLQLDDVKNDYKASRANSNQLSAAGSILESTLSQVQIWLPTIVGTNPK